MNDQLTLLRETPWGVLVILDACRADALTGVAAPVDVGACRSPGICTAGWLRAVAPWLQEQRPVYFTANPVVDREVETLGLDLCLVSAWKGLWAHHTPLGIPSVHPQAVNGVVASHLSDLDSHKIVVHYLQPHSPYIGRPALPLARWGRGEGVFWDECHALMQPGEAVERGRVTWADVREAYLGNVRLVWEAVGGLLGIIRRHKPDAHIIVTSDHGELLGEDGKFGHQAGWRHPKLREVPWVSLEGGGEHDVRTKLEALGYV